jgi:NADPH:quinone reductase
VKNIHLTRPVSFNYLGSREYVEEYAGALFELLLSGKVEVQHTAYPLKEVAKAHTDLESRKTTGKLVLKV